MQKTNKKASGADGLIYRDVDVARGHALNGWIAAPDAESFDPNLEIWEERPHENVVDIAAMCQEEEPANGCQIWAR